MEWTEAHAQMEEIAESLTDFWYKSLDDYPGYYLLEGTSPAGEDLCIEGSCDSPEEYVHTIAQDIKKRAEDYSVDKHVALWQDSAGKNGVPGIVTLVEDAQDIGKMLNDLSTQLDLV